ncbi:MAG TPA: DUF1499 domain-containing protein [Geobacter sp.]|nr:DUF1499 domain-containing protein [Geobacter sp.]
MDNEPRPKRSTDLVLPLFAAACGVGAVILLLSSGLGARLNIWHFRTGFTLITASAYIGLGCSLLALVSGVLSLRQRRPLAVAVSLAALLLALSAFAVPVYWRIQAQSYPRIHDISTDLHNPPRFIAISSLRKSGVRYGGAMVAAQQQKGYPDLKTVVLPLPKEQAFQRALGVAKKMGWEVVAAVPEEGRIEAVDTTRWFGFKDDISIRIYPAGDRSLLDIRSVSRVGISDVGTNAKRIRAFLVRLTPAP